MSVYLDTIRISLLTFILVAFAITFPFIFIEYRKYGFINFKKACIIFSFVFYVQTVFLLTSLPLPTLADVPRFQYNPLNYMQLVPFKFMYDLYLAFLNEPFKQALSSSAVYVNLFNLLMLLPLGIYLRNFFDLSFKKVFIFALLFSLFLELTQLTGLYFIYPVPYRLFDVDDIFINTMGALLGFLIAPMFSFISINQSKQIQKSQSLINQPATMIPQYVSLISDYILFNIIATFTWFIIVGVLYYVFKINTLSQSQIYLFQQIIKWILLLMMFVLYPLTSKNNQTLSMFLLNYRIEVPRSFNLILRNLILYTVLLGTVLWFPLGLISFLAPFLHLYIILLIILKKPQTFLDKILHVTYLRKKKGI